VHEELFELRRLRQDLLVAGSLAQDAPGGLQTIEGTLAAQRLAPIAGIPSAGTFQILFPAQQRQKRVGAQLIVVVEVSQAQSIDSLREQFVDAVLNEFGIAQIKKALRKPIQELLALLDLAKEQTTGVRGDLASIEGSHHRPTEKALKCQLLGATVCLHRTASPFLGKGFVVKHLYRSGRLFSITGVRNPG
jgi:hypothetical protein